MTYTASGLAPSSRSQPMPRCTPRTSHSQYTASVTAADTAMPISA